MNTLRIVGISICWILNVSLWGDPGEKMERNVSDFFPDIKDKNGDSFFPEKVGRRFSGTLALMGEVSLFAQREKADCEAIRFLCVPTFARPLAIKVYKTRDDELKRDIWKIRVVRLGGMGGFNVGKVDLEGVSILHEHEVKGLRNLLKTFKFQSLPADDKSVDGTHWVLEAVGNGRYRVMTDWSQGQAPNGKMLENGELLSKQFMSICEEMLELAEVELPKRVPVQDQKK